MSNLTMREATKVVYHDVAPQVVDPAGKAKTWITRGGNFAVCYSEVQPGAVLERPDNAEEYMVILPPDGTTASIEARGVTIAAGSDSLTIVPPGASKITATSTGVIVRIFSKAESDIMALSINADVYPMGHRNLLHRTCGRRPGTVTSCVITSWATMLIRTATVFSRAAFGRPI